MDVRRVDKSAQERVNASTRVEGSVDVSIGGAPGAVCPVTDVEGTTRFFRSLESQETMKMVQLVRELDANAYRDWENWEMRAAMDPPRDPSLLRVRVSGHVRQLSGVSRFSQSMDFRMAEGDDVVIRVQVERSGS